MTPERHDRILALINECGCPREMSGLRYGLQVQDEWVSVVLRYFATVAAERGWVIPEYGRD